jgi:hypothetical protein
MLICIYSNSNNNSSCGTATTVAGEARQLGSGYITESGTARDRINRTIAMAQVLQFIL